MKRFKPWLLLLLVFVAGFVGGIVATRIAVRHILHRSIKEPNYIRQMIERQMTAKLRLDARQQAEVHQILQHTQVELKSLRQDFQPRFLAVMSNAQSEISATLTPEQRRRFERFVAENHSWWMPR